MRPSRKAQKFILGVGVVAATYFTYDEFASPDDITSGELISPVLLGKLDAIREEVGFPIVINSGVRTLEHNRHVGGVANSAHTEPCYCAVDIKIRSRAQRDTIIASAKRHGINRIGIARTFVHLDIDTTKPAATWYY